MEIKLEEVRVDEKEILKNLMEKYEYEFSQWNQRDVNKLGLYGYDYLDCYWTEEKRFPYFIKVDDQLAGFVMVNDYPEVSDKPTDFVISEFFVMYKYRRYGVGSKAAVLAFDNHHGKWQLARHPKNIASVYFWDKVVSNYTNGNYEVIKNCPDAEYEDGTLGDVLLFDNSKNE